MTDTATASPPTTTSNVLFGRGMLYVLAWSGQLIFATLVSPVLTHVLPVKQFGVLAAAIALFQLLVLLSSFGLDQALEMQRVEDVESTRARGLLATGIASVLAVVGLCALTSRWWAPAFGFTNEDGMVYLTLLWAAPGACVLMILAFLQAEDRLARFITISVLSTVGGQALGLGLLFGVRSHVSYYTAGLIIAQTAALIIGCFWTRPRVRGILSASVTQRALRLGIPLALAGISEFVLTAGDRFIIQRFMGSEQVARYQVAFVIGNALTLLLIFTNRAWLPRLKSITDPAERWIVIGASRNGIYWLLGWALLAVTVASPPLLTVFVPSSYDRGPLTWIVFLVGICALPVAAGGAYSRMLITVRSSSPIAWSSAVALVVKLAVTAALLSPLGLSGAALGTLAGLTAQCLWLRRAVVRSHGSLTASRASLVFFLAAIVIAGASTQLPQSTTWNIARLIVGMACAVPLLLALRALQGKPSAFVTKLTHTFKRAAGGRHSPGRV